MNIRELAGSHDLTTMAHYFFGADGDVLFERRATRRYEIELTIGVHLDPGRDAVSGVVKDLSELGARVILPEAIGEGRHVEFRCAAFAGSARVIWIREIDSLMHVGLSFVEITEGREALHALLSGLSAGPREPLVAPW